MMYTSSLDVTQDYPDGLSESSVAFLLGVTEQAAVGVTGVQLFPARHRVHGSGDVWRAVVSSFSHPR